MRFWCLFVLLLPALLMAQEKGREMSDVDTGWLEVDGVVPGGAAAEAGIRGGDVLVTYDGLPANRLADLNALKEKVKNAHVEVVFRRGDQRVAVRLARGPLGIYFGEYLKDFTPDPDAKIIPGVEPLNWSSGKENTFMAALEAVLKQMGHDADYAFLCGVSGAAFRLHFCDPWCPSSVDPGCGYDATAAALDAVGVSARPWGVAPDGKNKPAIVKAIVASIDAGIPVMAIDLIRVPEWGVITGYQKNGEEFFCRTYFDRRKGYELAQKFPFMTLILEPPGIAADRATAYHRSFRIPVENLTTESYGRYYSGLAAFDKWVERLKTDDLPKLDSAGLATAVHANNWIFNRLVSDRKVGVEYLKRVAAALPQLKPQLDSLAALYTQESELLAPVYDQIPAMGSVTRPEQWTTDSRAAEIAALTRARVLEATALPIWQELAR